MPLVIDYNRNYNYVDYNGVEHLNFYPFVWIETEDDDDDEDSIMHFSEDEDEVFFRFDRPDCDSGYNST
jgi:hypothetical protein